MHLATVFFFCDLVTFYIWIFGYQRLRAQCFPNPMYSMHWEGVVIIPKKNVIRGHSICLIQWHKMLPSLQAINHHSHYLNINGIRNVLETNLWLWHNWLDNCHTKWWMFALRLLANKGKTLPEREKGNSKVCNWFLSPK